MSTSDDWGDPGGIFVLLFGRFFPPGWVESVIRTWVPIGVGGVLAWLGIHWHLILSPHASATAGIVATGLVVAAYYAVARLVERRWPGLGRWLLAFNLVTAHPAYVAPAETAHITSASSGRTRRVSGSATPRRHHP